MSIGKMKKNQKKFNFFNFTIFLILATAVFPKFAMKKIVQKKNTELCGNVKQKNVVFFERRCLTFNKHKLY